MNHVIVQATQGANHRVTVTITDHELGQANLRQATSMLRARGFCVWAHQTFVTDVDQVYLADHDMIPVIRLVNDIQIAALIDAGNTLVHGHPLRPMVIRTPEAIS